MLLLQTGDAWDFSGGYFSPPFSILCNFLLSPRRCLQFGEKEQLPDCGSHLVCVPVLRRIFNLDTKGDVDSLGIKDQRRISWSDCT